MKIVVTGGIACGKSTVVRRLLAKLPGYRHYDVDANVKALYDNPDFTTEIKSHFGTAERRTLSDTVFANPAKRALLEQISIRYLEASLGRALDEDDIVVEYPLLFELGRDIEKFDLIVVISCSTESQRTRLAARNGFAAAKIAQILGCQLNLASKVAAADIVVDTDAGPEAVDREIDAIVKIGLASSLKRQCLKLFGSETIWERIYAAYTEPHRHYHTLLHIASMLSALQSLGPLRHQHAVMVAIWFHDLVYSTAAGSGHNEIASAKVMRRLVRAESRQLASEIVDGIRTVDVATSMILATIRHKIPASVMRRPLVVQADCARFLDIDLGILAADSEVLAAYDNGVRREYSQYPEMDFAEGRAKVLDSFLSRSRIYYSEDFSSLEGGARSNLRLLAEKWRRRSTLLKSQGEKGDLQ